ncbi:hypothetical protein Btru_061422 [Bulinus truncatus]|nr:hypothetical protein Btru_061422 [Bulinus truncatus]
MEVTWCKCPDSPAAANEYVFVNESNYDSVYLNGARLECSDPGIGRHFQCVGGTTIDNYVEFVGNTAGEADVQFWYRFTLGHLAGIFYGYYTFHFKNNSSPP